MMKNEQFKMNLATRKFLASALVCLIGTAVLIIGIELFPFNEIQVGILGVATMSGVLVILFSGKDKIKSEPKCL